MNCSISKNFILQAQTETFLAILDSIRDGSRCRDEIEKMREYKKSKNQTEYDKLKKQLPAFTPSGIFKAERKSESLVEHSNIIHLDFDHIPEDQIENAITAAKSSPHTFALFLSPGGDGFKVFIEVKNGKEYHKELFQQISDHYSELTGFDPDPACKDVTRLCFFSYDPDLYYNPAHVVFPYTETPIQPIEDNQKVNEIPDTLDQIYTFTERVISNMNGSRNNFIYQFACNCNRKGISQDNTLNYAQQMSNLDPTEITKSVESAYVNNQHEFAKTANFADSANSVKAANVLLSTPTIPETVYNNLPELLKQTTDVFTIDREKDAFLIGALTIISGVLPDVTGLYDKQTTTPNLFAFIIAPAASGKGVLKFSKSLGQSIHKNKITVSEDNQAEYKEKLSEHKRKSRGRNGTDEPEPTPPPFEVLYIPGNTSYAKIIQHLKENNGSGIICETEADTLGNVFKQEWGNFSDLLRKSFHHETISSSKKGNNEFTEVDKPQLSVLLSGTPNQIFNIIPTSEDGLFSRFLFYAYKTKTEWKDVSPGSNTICYDDVFTTFSTQVHELYEACRTHQPRVLLSSEQWQKLNSSCSNLLETTTQYFGEDFSSVVYRLGIIIFRITMIFTVLRKYDENDMSETLCATDQDLENAIVLAKILLVHSSLIYENLPKQNAITVMKRTCPAENFISKLPISFTRKEAQDIGKKYKYSPRAIDEQLSIACDKGLIYKPRTGHYERKE